MRLVVVVVLAEVENSSGACRGVEERKGFQISLEARLIKELSDSAEIKSEQVTI